MVAPVRERVASLEEKRKLVEKTRSNQKRKKRINKFILTLWVVVFILGYSYIDMTLQIRENNKRIKEIREEIEALKQEQQQLQEEKERLMQNSYIEKIAREELGLIKKGEKVYIILNEDE